MTGQQKDWLKRFIEMGEAGDYIVEYLLDVKEEDYTSMSNEDLGAYTRAIRDIKKGVKQQKLNMKIQAR